MRSRTHYLGVVYAPDQKSAEAAAVAEFKISDGAKRLRKLQPFDIEAWHTALRTTVSARTIGHAHRLLSQALRDAGRNNLVSRNVAREQRAPKPDEQEMAIVQDVPTLIAALKGGATRLSPWCRCSLGCGSARCWRYAGTGLTSIGA